MKYLVVGILLLVFWILSPILFIFSFSILGDFIVNTSDKLLEILKN